MRVSRSLAAFAVCILLMSSNSYAHPGHGTLMSVSDDHSLTHYLTEPFHAVGIFGSAAVLIVGVVSFAKRRTAAKV